MDRHTWRHTNRDTVRVTQRNTHIEGFNMTKRSFQPVMKRSQFHTDAFLSDRSTACHEQTQIQPRCHLRPAVDAPVGGRELCAQQQRFLLRSRVELPLATLLVSTDDSLQGSSVHLQRPFLYCSTTKMSCR